MLGLESDACIVSKFALPCKRYEIPPTRKQYPGGPKQ